LMERGFLPHSSTVFPHGTEEPIAVRRDCG
jgi:hypothetical protein